MPIVIYDFENTPVEVVDRGHWLSDIDGKCVGWINFVPENLTTVKVILKDDFLERVKFLHSKSPYLKNSGEDIFEEPIQYTQEEILDFADKWYNYFTSLYEGKNINYGISK